MSDATTMTKLTMMNQKDMEHFWSKCKGHIGFLEQCVRLGHVEEFKARYNAVNDDIRQYHQDLRVEFGVDMIEGKITSIVVTSKTKGKTRQLAHSIVNACPSCLQNLVSAYRLPAIPWETEVTKEWLVDLTAQFGLQSISQEIGTCLANAEFSIKVNPHNGKVLIHVGFASKKELKAMDRSLVLLMLDLLLGEQILNEAIEQVTLKLSRELCKSDGWLQTNGLNVRDNILALLLL